jgi:metal-responsive CopG/Arc/MetJ family transcriptional regulator
MDTETTRLNITLPTALVKELKNLTAPRRRSRFVADALELKINQLKKETLENSLEEGYKASRNEAIEITEEFESIDIEGWDEY